MEKNLETTWKIYTSNPESWDAMIEACRTAATSIDLEAFIFMPDETGQRFIDACAEAAKRGVKVRFIWDAAGSFTFFHTGIIEELKAKSIELVFFKTFFPGFTKVHSYKSWYFRNHKRTLIIDRKIAFTGSTCIETRATLWRDTMVKVEGAVAEEMQDSFNQMWQRAHDKRGNRKLQTQRDVSFSYIENNPRPRRRFLNKTIIDAIRSAEKNIWITVPYFVPHHRLARVIRLAAHRGVDVKIILPLASDFPIVDEGARTFFHQLLKAGVRIYLYEGRLLHAKSIVIDGEWATVGTLNLDHISLMYNFEANLVSTERKFAEELQYHFEEVKSCNEVKLEEWNRRFFVEKIATFLVKFIRVFL